MSTEKEEAPQTLEDKLAAHQSTGGRARCRLHHLQTRIGFKVLESDGRGPLLVEIYPMDLRVRWRRVGEKGPEGFWFELESV